ncbi:MAG TPA: glutaredoxin 3 [Rhodanobacteraceae bacterium]|nr:glutaredoxin 3 [Rhodanobacteraceae bacterium]
MTDIEIYSTGMCPYCTAAKSLLRNRGLPWREFRIDVDAGARADMLRRVPGVRTVPQIFINGVYVGGFDQLAEAERNGELNQLLGVG